MIPHPLRFPKAGLPRFGGAFLPASDSEEVDVMPPLYLAGLFLSNAADADHDITIDSDGGCRDSGNAYDFTLSSDLTKQIDASWAAGNNAGGLFSGAVANSTWYAVHLIRKDSDGSIDAGFDTSSTAANIPAGYTAYRRIGWVRTDGSANIRRFTQVGDSFRYHNLVTDLNKTTSFSTSNTTLTLSAPPSTLAQIEMSIRAADGISRPIYLSVVGDSTNIMCVGRKDIDQQGHIEALIPIDSNSQIDYRFTSTSNYVSAIISTVGWFDTRGR